MNKIIIAGIGTEVGKTVVSAVIATLLEADYWKPVQCGEADTQKMAQLLNVAKHQIYPCTYSLKEPISPHHAARLENVIIDNKKITPPDTNRFLVIEMVGGIFVPLNEKTLSIDLFQSWESYWVLVSKHYLGSINHTLLTIEALKNRKIPILGIVFNGFPNPDSEKIILEISNLPFLGRLVPEESLNPEIIQKYAENWKEKFYHNFS